MKPHFHKVDNDLQSSFNAKHRIQPNFGKRWHYHPELELHYVIRGKGVRFIGDNISNFDSDELILVGENLPHTWRCEDEFYSTQDNPHSEAIVIQFLPDFIGSEFLQIPESAAIRQLFERAKKGLSIDNETKHGVLPLMKKLVQTEGMEKILLLLGILHILANSMGLSSIASGNNFYKSNEAESVRLNKIYSYTLENYRNSLPLIKIANVANLSVTSFCRYFKMMTNKSFHDFLMEIRISNACRLLIEDKLSIEAVCYECGFGNVSNFYRHFSRIKGLTPAGYKKQYFERTQGYV